MAVEDRPVVHGSRSSGHAVVWSLGGGGSGFAQPGKSGCHRACAWLPLRAKVDARNPLSPCAQEHAVPPEPLDATDCRILAVLQSNARIANVDLARAVHLSPSPCLRRVRRLEADGYLRDYVTLLDPAAIGLPVSVFIPVTLEQPVYEALAGLDGPSGKAPEAERTERGEGKGGSTRGGTGG